MAAHHSYVAPATLPDGSEAVLKVNLPDVDAELEADSLQLWDGRGAVRLLARDDDAWALLIERLRPGRQAWELPDEEATQTIAGVLQQLWIPADRPFRRLADVAASWVEELPARWERRGRPYERSVLDAAVDFMRHAAPEQRESVLLHQDGHGGNVLLSARGWLAIDSKPLVGEREFDVASLVRDRRPTTRAAMERRLDYLVDRLALDRERTRGWAIAHALAWNGDAEMIECARLLASG